MRILPAIPLLIGILAHTPTALAQLRATTTSGSGPSESTPSSTAFVPNAERQAAYRGAYDSVEREIQDRLRYPFWARASRVTGTIAVRFTIDERGTVRDAEVLHGPDFGLHAATLAALKDVRFSPAMQGDQPRPVRMALNIRVAPKSEILR